MATYTVEVRRGDRVINTIAGKEFSDQREAWRFVEELSYHYDGPGMRVVVKDANGGVFLMAGFTAVHSFAQQKRACRGLITTADEPPTERPKAFSERSSIATRSNLL